MGGVEVSALPGRGVMLWGLTKKCGVRGQDVLTLGGAKTPSHRGRHLAHGLQGNRQNRCVFTGLAHFTDGELKSG